MVTPQIGHTTIYRSEVKVMAVDPEDLSWIPRTQWERTNSPKLYSHLKHTHTNTRTYARTRTRTYIHVKV